MIVEDTLIQSNCPSTADTFCGTSWNRTQGLYVLLSRVVELVFAGAAEALLHARVSPEANHGGEELCGIGLCVFHATHHVTHHLSIRLWRAKLGSGAFLIVVLFWESCGQVHSQQSSTINYIRLRCLQHSPMLHTMSPTLQTQKNYCGH